MSLVESGGEYKGLTVLLPCIAALPYHSIFLSCPSFNPPLCPGTLQCKTYGSKLSRHQTSDLLVATIQSHHIF